MQITLVNFTLWLLRKNGKKIFEELYVKTIHMATKNKEHKEKLEAITMEQDTLEEKIKCKEMELNHSKTREEEFQEQLTSKEKDINKLLGRSHMLLHEKSPLCKIGLGDTTIIENSTSPSTLSKLPSLGEKTSPRRLALP